MADNGATPEHRSDRRTSLLVGLAIVVAILVFLVGFLLGRGNDDTTAATSSTPLPSPTASPSPPPSATASAEPTPSPSTSEPGGDELPDDTYFVQLADLEGGEDGPAIVVYDLAYFLTGQEADDAAAERGLETPVPNGYFIVNDNPKLRKAPLADGFSVKYIPEGSGQTTPVKAHQAQFLGWLSGSVQTDFPPKDTSWWWITMRDDEIVLIKQQYLP